MTHTDVKCATVLIRDRPQSSRWPFSRSLWHKSRDREDPSQPWQVRKREPAGSCRRPEEKRRRSRPSRPPEPPTASRQSYEAEPDWRLQDRKENVQRFHSAELRARAGARHSPRSLMVAMVTRAADREWTFLGRRQKEWKNLVFKRSLDSSGLRAWHLPKLKQKHLLSPLLVGYGIALQSRILSGRLRADLARHSRNQMNVSWWRFLPLKKTLITSASVQLFHFLNTLVWRSYLML